MNPDIYSNSPLRSLKWRAECVMQMVEHQPSPLKPRHYDDPYVRAYRRFLLSLMAAGDDEVARFGVINEAPHVYHAHTLHYDSDRWWRNVVEARLLTVEPLAEIANKLATDPRTIEYYEALFFCVRDRLHNRNWIEKVIQRPFGELPPNLKGDASEDQRGYLLRLFAYRGGPLVLDAILHGTPSAAKPERAEDAAKWFDDSLSRTLRSRLAEVASVLEINKHNTPLLIKMALRSKRAGLAAKSRTKSAKADDQRIEDIAAALAKLLPKQ